jgi:hypothetical protein
MALLTLLDGSAHPHKADGARIYRFALRVRARVGKNLVTTTPVRLIHNGCGALFMHLTREVAMTILDPTSGQHVTIGASGRPHK